MANCTRRITPVGFSGDGGPATVARMGMPLGIYPYSGFSAIGGVLIAGVERVCPTTLPREYKRTTRQTTTTALFAWCFQISPLRRWLVSRLAALPTMETGASVRRFCEHFA